MPATAVDVASRMGRPPGDLTDPEENLELGAWYLRWLQGYVGAPWSAVLAYNGGPGRVRSWLSEWEPLPPDLAIEAVPLPETRNYGRNLLVSSLYYGYLYYQLPPDLGFQNFFGTGLF
jgi:soluble lytic murein transglycosylase